MPRSTERWAFLAQPERGHKFFHDRQNNRLALADDSGDTPEDTEDGILYVDVEKCARGALGISVGHVLARSADVAVNNIPLLKPDGTRSSTVCSVDEMLWLAEHLHCQVYAYLGGRDKTYKLVKED